MTGRIAGVEMARRGLAARLRATPAPGGRKADVAGLVAEGAAGRERREIACDEIEESGEIMGREQEEQEEQAGAGRMERPNGASLPHGVFRVLKFAEGVDPDAPGAEPYETIESLNNFTDAGAAAVAKLLAGIGSAATIFDATNAYLGVGNGTAANVGSMTDLSGASKLRKGMDSTYPVLTARTVTWQARFGNSEANFAWEEIGLFNASSSGVMMSRTLNSQGTKSGGTWMVQYVLSIPDAT